MRRREGTTTPEYGVFHRRRVRNLRLQFFLLFFYRHFTRSRDILLDVLCELFQDRSPMFWKYSTGVHAIGRVSEVVAETVCDVCIVMGLTFWLRQVSVVLPTVAVFAWPPSASLCTPSPPVDARRGKHRDSAIRCRFKLQPTRKASWCAIPRVRPKHGVKGAVAIHEKSSPVFYCSSIP